MTEWRIPRPHEVILTLFMAASTLLVVGIFGHDTKGEKLLQALVMLTGTSGGFTAARAIPRRVQEILDQRDEVISKALETLNGEWHK